MIYLADSANPKGVRELIDIFPISGVTTNPTIVAREKCDYGRMLREMREVLGADMMLHVQTLQTEAHAMVREALRLQKAVGGNFYIKVPATPQGLKAIRLLRAEGVPVTATAIFSAEQAMLCARAGAAFVAPYVNKLSDLCVDAVRVVEEIVREFNIHHLDCRVLAASFRNVDQVNKMALAGSHAITLPLPFYDKLIDHPMTTLALEGFRQDWRGVYGERMPEDMV